jgi:serine/threonine protein phosphatase PrpC
MSIVHYVSKKGKRKSNEDNHSIYLYLDQDCDKPKVNFYAVYDGHGGKYVSSYLAKNLPGCFIHPKVTFPLRKYYVNGIYDAIESELYSKHENEATDCGSTCLVVCHYRLKGDEYIDVMNTGDSRLVGCNNSFIAESITLDHKPGLPMERRRLEALGARLGHEIWNDRGDMRINDLSVSRAFGDKSSEKYVTCKPDLYTHKVTNSLKFIILACDGLWDVMSCQEAVDIVIDACYDCNNKRIENPKMIVDGKETDLNIAEKLGSIAIDEKGSTDNVTSVVVFFN